MKEMRFFKIALALIFILFSSFCCEDVEYFPEYNRVEHVIVVNQTDEVILVHANEYNEGELDRLFYNGNNSRFISPGEADKVSYCIFWDDGISMRNIYKLFIIKQRTFNKYTLNEIFEQNIYDDVLSFTFDELFESNFRINYK